MSPRDRPKEASPSSPPSSSTPRGGRSMASWGSSPRGRRGQSAVRPECLRSERYGFDLAPVPDVVCLRSQHLWPVLDEPLANRYFETLADLERVVADRCRVLEGDQLSLGTNFHWWPKPATPR